MDVVEDDAANGNKSIFKSINPSLGCWIGGWTISALILHRMFVLDPGRNIREEPLDRIGVAVTVVVVVSDPCWFCVFVLMSVYGRVWRLDLPSKRKLCVQDDNMDVISD